MSLLMLIQNRYTITSARRLYAYYLSACYLQACGDVGSTSRCSQRCSCMKVEAAFSTSTSACSSLPDMETLLFTCNFTSVTSTFLSLQYSLSATFQPTPVQYIPLQSVAPTVAWICLQSSSLQHLSSLMTENMSGWQRFWPRGTSSSPPSSFWLLNPVRRVFELCSFATYTDVIEPSVFGMLAAAAAKWSLE